MYICEWVVCLQKRNKYWFEKKERKKRQEQERKRIKTSRKLGQISARNAKDILVVEQVGLFAYGQQFCLVVACDINIIYFIYFNS